MGTNGNERHMATSGAGGQLNRATIGTKDGEHKEIPTVVTAKYTGDYKAAAGQAILNNLHNQAFWHMVKKGYSPEEIGYFEEEWCAFVIQLDDNVTATEQMQLRQLIVTQINLDRLAIRERKTFAEAEKIEEEVQHLKDKFWKAKDNGEDEVEIEFLQGEITRLNALGSALVAAKQSFERDRDNLVKSQSQIMKDLNVTRAKRVEKSDISDKTWAKMLMEIKENPRIKKQLNAMAYISFLATEYMRGKLTQEYEFANGDVHSPLLLPEGCVNGELMGMVEALYVPCVEEEQTKKEFDYNEKNKLEQIRRT